MNIVNSVFPGEVVINGKSYFSDVFIPMNGDVEMIEKKFVFTLDDLLMAARKGFDTVIFGTGIDDTCKIENSVLDFSEHYNIDVYIEKSKKAIKIFNSFVKTGIKVCMFLHVR